jgi:TolB-like protein/DNA-binding winged helix-turn-helix (wHTH) protein
MRADNFQTAVRFGPYEVNFRVGELRKNGIRIRIQSKPLAFLAVLVEKAGEVVSREQLRAALWHDDTFVDFGKNLTTAVNKLRGALSDSPERPRYIETVPRRGYRFLAQVENLEAAFSAQPAIGSTSELSTGEVESQSAPSISGERRASGEKRRYVEISAGRDHKLTMPVKLQPKDSGGLHKPSPTGARRTKVIDSLAVLPFVNASADAEAEFLSDGITENLMNFLSQIPKLRVIPRTTAFRYKGVEVDPQRAGHKLHVRAVLTGRVQQRGETLVIQTELVDICSEAQVWGGQYRRKLSDLLAV